MRILILSPYHGGSHQAWVNGYQAHSALDIQVLSMPARFWKWRMQSSATTLARQFLEGLESGRPEPDLILATDMLDSATFLALTRKRAAHIPLAIYMHENQLTYPPSPHTRRGKSPSQMTESERHYAFINVLSMLAADQIFFNSAYHRNLFLNTLPQLLGHYPEYQELETVDILSARSSVLSVGVDFERLDESPALSESRPGRSKHPLVLWNQRWEHDKNPELFLHLLAELAEEGTAFRLALAGERFGKQLPSFVAPLTILIPRVIFNAYASREQYNQLLWSADVTFSVARHEYFGISILEAIHANTLALLPNRLSYPEIIPAAFHDLCLYENRPHLKERLRWSLTHREQARALAQQIAMGTAHFSWKDMAPLYDSTFTKLARSNRGYFH